MEPEWSAASGFAGFRESNTALGFQTKPSKEQQPAAAQLVQGVVLELTDLGVTCSPKPARVARMSFDIRHALSTGRLAPAPAGRMAWKAGFLCTTCFGRVGRAAVKPLFSRQHAATYLSLVTPPLRSGLQALLAIFSSAPPRFIPFAGARAAALLYADAFFELGGSAVRPSQADMLPPAWATSWTATPWRSGPRSLPHCAASRSSARR